MDESDGTFLKPCRHRPLGHQYQFPQHLDHYVTFSQFVENVPFYGFVSRRHLLPPEPPAPSPGSRTGASSPYGGPTCASRAIAPLQRLLFDVIIRDRKTGAQTILQDLRLPMPADNVVQCHVEHCHATMELRADAMIKGSPAFKRRFYADRTPPRAHL